MRTSKRTGIYIGLVLISAIAYRLYDVKQDKKAEIELVNKVKSGTPVITAIAGYEAVRFDISYHGIFEPSSEVTVVSESQGIVKNYSINEGDFVSEGQTIAWLDNELTGYRLETAEAAWLKALDELNRFENLPPGEAVSRQQLEEIKLTCKNAQCTYQTIKKQYSDAFIKTPISGTVSKRYFEKGSFINPGNPVADIINTRKMKFNAWFTAKDLTRIKTGQKVRLTSDLYPGIFYEGTVKVIGVKPDISKRYLVQAEVYNSTENPLFSGMDGTIRFKYFSGSKSLVIPRNCLVSTAMEPMVWVISENKAKLREIVVSAMTDSLVIIENGLTNGERVVLSGQINLEDNTLVTLSDIQNL